MKNKGHDWKGMTNQELESRIESYKECLNISTLDSKSIETLTDYYIAAREEQDRRENDESTSEYNLVCNV